MRLAAGRSRAKGLSIRGMVAGLREARRGYGWINQAFVMELRGLRIPTPIKGRWKTRRGSLGPGTRSSKLRPEGVRRSRGGWGCGTVQKDQVAEEDGTD